MRRRGTLFAGFLTLSALLAGAVVWLNLAGEAPLSPDTGGPASPELIARGAYLARAGNCAGCHTERGGIKYAGGRGVPTPFGTVYAPNLTPDDATGLGRWTPDEFWRALHHGRSRDGRLLYPAFPYPNYTQVARADADALFAYLKSLAPTVQANKPHTLPFPFDQQAALAVWRALYFRPGAPPVADAAHDAVWTRGAYLVEGLGHCNACHASRNALGATSGPLDLAGGLIPVQNWYAPSLTTAAEAGVADWPEAQIVALLKTGITVHVGTNSMRSPGAPDGITSQGAVDGITSQGAPYGITSQGAVMGPMSEVVSGSTQHLDDADLHAIAVYLKALPQTAAPVSANAEPASSAASTATTSMVAIGPGAALYERYCIGCHGAQGEGAAGLYPALAGNRAVLLRTPVNLVHLVLEGGFPPATAGNPRPFGMPPFATVLSDDEIAALLTTLRSSWGNRAGPVAAVEVALIRGGR